MFQRRLTRSMLAAIATIMMTATIAGIKNGEVVVFWLFLAELSLDKSIVRVDSWRVALIVWLTSWYPSLNIWKV